MAIQDQHKQKMENVIAGIVRAYKSVYLPQRKNDQYQEGHTAFLARTGKVTCLVAVTERLIKLCHSLSLHSH